MDDPFAVNMFQRLGDRKHHRYSICFGIGRLLVDQLFQRPSPHQLHDQYHPPVVIEKIINMNDAGMRQLGQGQCFTAKPLPEFGVPQRSSWQLLESHGPLKRLVETGVNNPHCP